MADEDNILYEDPQIRIESAPYEDEHFLYLTGCSPVDKSLTNKYSLARGILREFATTPRPGLERKILTYNDYILIEALEGGMTADSLGVAMAQAHIEEQARFIRYLSGGCSSS